MVRERRRTYRIRSHSPEPARLKTNAGEWTGVLRDHSAGGFGVQFPGRLPIAPEAIGTLTTNQGYYQVRVARVEFHGQSTDVGFERLADLPVAEDLRSLRPTWRSYFPPLPKAIIQGMTWYGIGIALLLVAGIWFGQHLITRAPFGLPELPAPSATSLIRSASNKTTPVAPTTPRMGTAPAKTPPATSSFPATTQQDWETVTVLGSQARLPREYGKLFVHKAQFLEFIALPEVADALALTEEQRSVVAEQMAKLRTSIQERVHQLHVWDEAALAALQEIHEAVLRALNASQRRQIELMLERAGK